MCVKIIIRHKNREQLFVMRTDVINLITLERNPCSNCFIFGNDVFELNSRNTVLSKVIHQKCMLTCTVYSKPNPFIFFILSYLGGIYLRRANVCVNPASGSDESRLVYGELEQCLW